MKFKDDTEDLDDMILKIFELGYRDAKKEKDYDPQSHEEVYELQLKVRRIQKEKSNLLDELDECDCLGEVSKLLRFYGR
ncbi:hypothetical protein S14_12 [Shewanella sp. phage 1/4]|uniref:hypothetical protein n=1 Tax=Shewanella phage 1/4 TaxID=1458859 RepID=UPI0004F5DE2A|nr:hypothetical protein S14_12 [Shewanella sp. phage 1/4]AHK11124.1 hypothetical protein S14_12 [Shewanella sp. phage 1/4]